MSDTPIALAGLRVKIRAWLSRWWKAVKSTVLHRP